MISERISQIFMYDIRDDIKYDIKHDIKVSLPILKTGCIERCQSRALQVQVQAVQNQWWWSSALLDEARLVLGVRRIQTGYVRHRVSQSIIVLGPWTSAPQPCSARLPRRPTESAPVDAPALLRRRPRRRRRVVLLEVEHAACKNSSVRWAFQLDLEWHYNMDTTGIPAEHTQSVFQLECEWRCEKESTDATFEISAYRGIRRTFAGLDANSFGAQ